MTPTTTPSSVGEGIRCPECSGGFGDLALWTEQRSSPVFWLRCRCGWEGAQAPDIWRAIDAAAEAPASQGRT